MNIHSSPSRPPPHSFGLLLSVAVSCFLFNLFEACCHSCDYFSANFCIFLIVKADHCRIIQTWRLVFILLNPFQLFQAFGSFFSAFLLSRSIFFFCFYKLWPLSFCFFLYKIDWSVFCCCWVSVSCLLDFRILKQTRENDFPSIHSKLVSRLYHSRIKAMRWKCEEIKSQQKRPTEEKCLCEKVEEQAD